MAAQVQILPAGWRDWRGIYALEKPCFGPDAWSGLDLFLALLGASAIRLKAVAGKKVVGFAMGELHPVEEVAWIATLGVHPAYQRQGIGARLLAEVEARLTLPRIKLTVRQSNLSAIKLYEKFGYRSVHAREGYYASGETGVVMEKKRG
jgi:ribosomal-protein-alanine N-acetyltransferase